MDEDADDKGAGWRRWIVRAIFQSGLIVISIVVALGVNEWRDRRELQARAHEARRAFARELNANRETLLAEQCGLPNRHAPLEQYREVTANAAVNATHLRRDYDE